MQQDLPREGDGDRRALHAEAACTLQFRVLGAAPRGSSIFDTLGARRGPDPAAGPEGVRNSRL